MLTQHKVTIVVPAVGVAVTLVEEIEVDPIEPTVVVTPPLEIVVIVDEL